jgi:PKD repeat protein
MDVNLTNLGTDASSDVTITVSTDDEYCTLTSAATVEVGSIDPDETILIEDAFTFAISDEAPDMHMVNLTINIEGTAKETWDQDIHFNIYAPVPEFGNYTIDDSNGGNSNGRLDPGETVDITIATWNNGHAASLLGDMIVSSSSSYLTVNTSNIDVEAIDSETYTEVTFNVTADASTPIGTVVDMNLDYISGYYTTSKMIQEAVGLILEDFETGDFTMFDWTFNSFPWTTDEEEVYEGNYSAKSGNIGDSEDSEMILEYNVLSDGEISFFYKVSSEGNYDELQFYIDGSMQDEWSGEVNWTQAVYDVDAGLHTFKWTYHKDINTSSGSDCAWVDYIVLPSGGESVLVAAFDVDNNNPCDGETINFTSNSIGDVSEWNWTFEGGEPATSTEENPSVTYATPGTYTVSLEVGDGVETATITKEDYIVVHNCTGVNEVVAGVNIYPNPNNGVFYMDLQGMESADLKIYNAVGTVVYEESNFVNDNSMKRIDLSQQAEGVYMLIIENDDQKLIEKIVVK